MLRRQTTKSFAAAAAVAAAGVLLAAGCSATAGPAAFTQTPAAPGSAADTAPAAAAITGGPAHLTATTDGDGPTDSVIVTGAVGDYGTAESVYPDGRVDPDHDSELRLQLARGTFRLDIAALDKAFVAAALRAFPTDASTCSGSVAVTGRVPVVPGSGTGAYRGIGGSFTLTATLDEVAKPDAAQPCSGTDAFLSQEIVISGPGKVSF